MTENEEKKRIEKLVAEFRRDYVAMNEDDCESLRNKISFFAFEIRQSEKRRKQQQAYYLQRWQYGMKRIASDSLSNYDEVETG